MQNFTKFIALLAVAAVASAQDRGSIRGTITDPSGAAVPEATVTVKNVDTGLTQTVRTNADGVYTVPYLPVGKAPVRSRSIGSMNVAFAFGSDSSSLSIRLAFSGILVF